MSKPYHPEADALADVLEKSLKQMKESPEKWSVHREQLERALHHWSGEFVYSYRSGFRCKGEIMLKLISTLENALKDKPILPKADLTAPKTLSVLLAHDSRQIRSYFISHLIGYFVGDLERPVIILRINDSTLRWAFELASYRSGIPLEQALDGEIDNQAVNLLIKAIEEFNDSPCDLQELGPHDIQDLIRHIGYKIKNQEKAMVLIDGLDLVPGFPQAENIYSRLKEICLGHSCSIMATLYPDFSLSDGVRKIKKYALETYPNLLNIADHVAYFQPGVLTRNPFLLNGDDFFDELE
jgi:hypothetical protein